MTIDRLTNEGKFQRSPHATKGHTDKDKSAIEEFLAKGGEVKVLPLKSPKKKKQEVKE